MIVVAGEALIDLLSGPDGSIVAKPGGGPYNTARTIARLGQPVRFLGRLSGDRFGHQLRENLERDGVVLDGLVSTDDPTTLAVAELDDRGTAEYRFYLDGTSAAGMTRADVTRFMVASMAALHVGTLGLVLEPTGTTIEALATGADDETLVMVDPNCRPSATADPDAFAARIHRLARRADVVKVSDDDLRFLDRESAPEATIDRLLAAGVSVVLRTDGGRAVEVRTTEERHLVPVPAVDVVDTVGAGDAFGGAFLATWVAAGRRRKELADAAAVIDAVRFAIRVAGMTCMRAGADPPTLAEVGELIGR